MTETKVMCFGEILWDMLPEGRQLGGAPFNVAHGLKQDFQVSLISAVGRDQNGRDIQELLKAESVSLDGLCELESQPTGTVEVQLNDKGVPSYIIHEAVAWDFIPFPNHLGQSIAEQSAFIFGSLALRNVDSYKTFTQMISSLSSDCLKVCDLNLRQSYYSVDLIDELLNLASHLKINDEELAVINSRDSEREALLKLQEQYQLESIALTKGDEGSLILDFEGNFHHLRARELDVVDTVGAGDAFLARWVKGLLLGESTEELHCACQEAGALACQRKGAVVLASLEM